MIVLDASVVVELLTNGILAGSIRSELAGRNDSFIVPHLIDIEGVRASPSLAATKRTIDYNSRQFLEGLRDLPAGRYSHTPLLHWI
jgi:hypothetical protein